MLGLSHPGRLWVPQAWSRLLSSCSRSPALLSGIPVVRGLRCVRRWGVSLHGGLLFRAGPGPGDQHRCVLVPAHPGLLSVSLPGGLASGLSSLLSVVSYML